jgi:hypothetical protein
VKGCKYELKNAVVGFLWDCLGVQHPFSHMGSLSERAIMWIHKDSFTILKSKCNYQKLRTTSKKRVANQSSKQVKHKPFFCFFEKKEDIWTRVKHESAAKCSPTPYLLTELFK